MQISLKFQEHFYIDNLQILIFYRILRVWTIEGQRFLREKKILFAQGKIFLCIPIESRTNFLWFESINWEFWFKVFKTAIEI